MNRENFLLEGLMKIGWTVTDAGVSRRPGNGRISGTTFVPAFGLMGVSQSVIRLGEIFVPFRTLDTQRSRLVPAIWTSGDFAVQVSKVPLVVRCCYICFVVSRCHVKTMMESGSIAPRNALR